MKTKEEKLFDAGYEKAMEDVKKWLNENKYPFNHNLRKFVEEKLNTFIIKEKI